jgi:hypothetical protein
MLKIIIKFTKIIDGGGSISKFYSPIPGGCSRRLVVQACHWPNKTKQNSKKITKAKRAGDMAQVGQSRLASVKQRERVCQESKALPGIS